MDLKKAEKTLNELEESSIKVKQVGKAIEKFKDMPLKFLSRGNIQRNKLCIAMNLNWDYLLIDEPFSNLDAEGVKIFRDIFNNFKSDELKASPNPTEKLTPEARQATMDSIYEVYDYFIEIVATRRNLDLEYVKKLADGRIYSGRQALDLKLIDAIGNEDTAIKWLQEQKGISKDLDVVDVRLSRKDKCIDILMEDFQTSISNFFSFSFKGLKSII